MDNNALQPEKTCCIDYCKQTFTVDGQEVVNTYLCGQKPVTAADVWNILKQRRSFGRK